MGSPPPTNLSSHSPGKLGLILTTVEDGAALAGVGAKPSAIALRCGGHLGAVCVEGHGARGVGLGLGLLGRWLGLGLGLGLGAHHAEVPVGGCREAIGLYWGGGMRGK